MPGRQVTLPESSSRIRTPSSAAVGRPLLTPSSSMPCVLPLMQESTSRSFSLRGRGAALGGGAGLAALSPSVPNKSSACLLYTSAAVVDAALGALALQHTALAALGADAAGILHETLGAPALGEAAAGKELAELAHLDDHGASAEVADLAGRFIGHLDVYKRQALLKGQLR